MGTLSNVPMDLEAEALDSEGATCHVCDAVATVLVQMLDSASDVGEAIYLCDQDFELITNDQVERVAERLAKNYSEPTESYKSTATVMTNGSGRSVRLPQPGDAQ
jgi:hypothetical protein